MKRITTIILMLGLFTASCVKEDHFGYSGYGNIKSFLVTNQSGNAVIDNESLSIEVEIPDGIDLSAIVIEDLQLSSYATSDKKIGDVLDLNTEQYISVTAEDGSIHIWTVRSYVASDNPQLANGDLNAWYQTGSGYYEPGEDAASTIWGTGNQGTQILGLLATTPYDLGDGNKAAKMETMFNGNLPASLGMPISAGSIFTGYFNPDNLDPTDPEAAIEFGTPFTGRPAMLRFKYQFQAGEENKDRDGNPLPYPDALDIYALLEVRLGGNTERLATAWFRSEASISDLTSMEISFTYGELDDSFPDYMKPDNDAYVSADSASFVLPTHITFVASSSYDGANFSGAVGSILIVDDVEMVYED